MGAPIIFLHMSSMKDPLRYTHVKILTVQRPILIYVKKRMQRVFVYGTLKSGQPNHHLIQEGLSSGECRYEGVGVTELKYPLVVASHWKVPFLLDAPDTPCAQVSQNVRTFTDILQII